MPVEYGVYQGGGDALRRGIGGIGDMLAQQGLLQMQMQENAEQRAWQQYQAEENRRRWEEGMRVDRQREQRLQQQFESGMAAQGAAAIGGATSPAEVEAAVGAYEQYAPGYREGTEPFEVQSPNIPGMGDMTASMAPGAPAYSPMASAGRARVGELESAAAAPDMFTAAGREFPDTPEGHAAAVAWRNRLFDQGGGGGSGFRPTGGDVRTVLDPLIPSSVDPITTEEVRTPEDQALYARMFSDLRSGAYPLAEAPDSAAAAMGRRAPADSTVAASPEEGPGFLSRVGRMFGGDEPGRLRGPEPTADYADEGEGPEPFVRASLDRGASEEDVVNALVADGMDEEEARALVAAAGG